MRDVIMAVAPGEIPLVEAMATLDDSAVIQRLNRRRGRRDPLGFGVAEVAALATPVVWLAVDQAAKQLGDAAGDEVSKGAKALVRRLFRRPAGPVEVPALTREQITSVRRHVLELAAQHGLDVEKATALADAVAVRLAAVDGQAAPDPDPDLDQGAENNAQ
ncbi:hypothetical protein [Nocardia sp. NBC_01009]|uniref:hypothetical protein n=1 Tax=Nocardia sp. NBC_01009 TaxID=2975996 RepID=UPI00386E89BD|nr:hypothetical protein OHA42_38180 [Nocardia sp. NBC_01009]